MMSKDDCRMMSKLVISSKSYIFSLNFQIGSIKMNDTTTLKIYRRYVCKFTLLLKNNGNFAGIEIFECSIS